MNSEKTKAKMLTRREEKMAGLSFVLIGILSLAAFLVRSGSLFGVGMIFIPSFYFFTFSGLGALATVGPSGEREGIFLFGILVYRKDAMSKMFRMPFGIELAFNFPTFLIFIRGTRSYKYISEVDKK